MAPQPCRSFSRICLAIGADTAPPKPFSCFSSTTATATLRVVGGREADEPGRVDVVDAGLGGAGLAGDLDAGDLRRRAGAALDDRDHHLRQLGGGLRLDRAAEVRRPRPCGRSSRRGATIFCRRRTASGRCRRWRSSTATIAICSGVASIVAWPKASRPGSTCGRRVLREPETGRPLRPCRGRSARARSRASRAAASCRSRTSSRSRGSSSRRSSCRRCRRPS